MTDKELKKLSRLELLELLLESSKENKELKEKINKLKLEKRTAQSIENLSAATQQIESALKYANTLTNALREAPSAKFSAPDSLKSYPQKEEPSYRVKSSDSDRDIYWRTMGFFARNKEALDMLPEDLKNDVENRINDILTEIKKNR